MAVTLRMARAAALVLGATILGLAHAAAEDATPTKATAPASAVPSPTVPASAVPGTFTPAEEPDVWIFSGILDGNQETYSGTLVSGRTDTHFELKLADGATCDGDQLNGDVGMVRLSEIHCSDGRAMRALFVPQGGHALKVFGHVGDLRFAAAAHLLGTEPEPDQKQTMEPTVPQVLPTIPGALPPGASPPGP